MITTTLLLIGGISITLPQEAQVRGTEVSLGEVASIRGEDPAAVQRFRELSLGYAPAPGYSRLFSKRAIEVRVNELLAGESFEVSGAVECRVFPEVETVEKSSIEAAALKELRRLFASTEAEISLKSELRDLVVPKGSQPMTVRATIEGKTLRPGLWNVPVQVLVDGTVYQTVWTALSVEMWDTHLVLARDVVRGEALTPALFHTSRVKRTAQASSTPVDLSQLIDAVALRDMAAGSVVTDRDVQRQVVIKRGDMLSLEVTKGSITARTIAVARQDGRIGDRIRVSMSEGGRELVAVVVSKDSVQVRL